MSILFITTSGWASWFSWYLINLLWFGEVLSEPIGCHCSSVFNYWRSQSIWGTIKILFWARDDIFVMEPLCSTVYEDVETRGRYHDSSGWPLSCTIFREMVMDITAGLPCTLNLGCGCLDIPDLEVVAWRVSTDRPLRCRQIETLQCFCSLVDFFLLLLEVLFISSLWTILVERFYQ